MLENDQGQAQPYSVHHYLTGYSLVHLSLARDASVPTERLDAIRKLAASLQCPLLFAEDQVRLDSVICSDVVQRLSFLLGVNLWIIFPIMIHPLSVHK